MLHPDAAGRKAKNRGVLAGEPFTRPARVPTRQFDAALRRAGVPCRLSIDAGDYVCNQTFYLSLAMTQGTCRRAGFVHVPKMPPSLLARAAILLIMALLPSLRQPVSRGGG
jgi:pyroglutamyl-peptidase